MKTGFAIVGFIVVALVVGTCVACIDDDEDERGLGWVEVAEYDYDHDERDNRGGGGEDCRDARAHCEDNDASPSFQDSPVEDSFNATVCVLPDSCYFEGEDDTAT